MEIASILPVVGTAVGFMLIAFGIVLLIVLKGRIVGAVLTAGLLVAASSMYCLILQDSKTSLEENSAGLVEKTAGSKAMDIRQKRSEEENIKTAAVESSALNKPEMTEAYEQEIMEEMEYISLQLSSTMEALMSLNQNKNSDYWHQANEELLALDAALNKAQKVVYEPQGYENFQSAYHYALTELLDYSDQLSFAAEEYYYGLDTELLEYYMLNRGFPENVTDAFDMMENEGKAVFQHEEWKEEIDSLFPER